MLCYHDAAVGMHAGVSGVDILNVLGSADHKAVGCVASSALKDSFEQLTLLPELPFGVAMTLLRKCISVRADYCSGSCRRRLRAGWRRSETRLSSAAS